MPAVVEDDFLGGVVFEFVYVGVDEDHKWFSFIRETKIYGTRYFCLVDFLSVYCVLFKLGTYIRVCQPNILVYIVFSFFCNSPMVILSSVSSTSH